MSFKGDGSAACRLSAASNSINRWYSKERREKKSMKKQNTKLDNTQDDKIKYETQKETNSITVRV